MKHTKFSSILFFMLSGFIAQAQSSDIVKIEFNSLTRGYHEQITISADTLKVVEKNDRTDQKEKLYCRRISTTEWSNLIKSLSGLPLAEISELKSPTMNRSFDGARHSSLIITTKNDQSFGHAFDDENPHKKLELLMKTIRQTVYKRKKK